MRYQPTDDDLVLLYELTHKFTYALKNKYFIQYDGDLDDLASDYFLSFITPKSRTGEKLTIYDHYNPDWEINPTWENFEGYVRSCVINKLIDSSRLESAHRHVSIDNYIEEFGDIITKTFDLSNEDEQETKDRLSDPKFIAKVIAEYNKLSVDKRNQFFFDLYDSNSTVVKFLRPKIHYVLGLPIYQVTDSNVMVYSKKLNRIVRFDRKDGHAKGYTGYRDLTKDELETIDSFVDLDSNLYWCQTSSQLFIEYLNEVA